MKDYELDKSKKGQFILNYVIKGDKIVVNYANGDKVSIDNTEKNEAILLNHMEIQAQESDTFLKSCKGNFAIYAVLFLIGIVGCIPGIRTLISNPAAFMLFNKILFGVSVAGAVFAGIEMIIIDKAIEDVEKNKYFLAIEDELNSKVRENENILYNTHKVTKNIVKNAPEDRRVVFTINNVDKVPFSDLARIVDNIEREEKFNFEYPEEEPVKKKGLLK